MATVGALVDRAIAACDALAVVGEEIDDEWQYIADLGEAWRAALEAAVLDRADELAPPAVEAAIDWLIAEAGRVAEPHRAIDWLSTLPQAVLLALSSAGRGPGGATG